MKRQMWIGVVILSVGFAAGYFGQRRAAAPVPPQETSAEFCSRTLPQVEVHATTLAGLMDELRGITHGNVVVDWSDALRHAIRKSTPISPDISFHDVTMQQLLERISKTTNGDQAHLHWSWNDGILHWTVVDSPSRDFGSNSDDADGRNTVNCVYDISSLIENGAWETLAFDESHKRLERSLRMDERSEIVQSTIMSLVAPDSWLDVGGTSGTMREFYGKLMVTQTPANQRAVYSVIQTLRAAR